MRPLAYCATAQRERSTTVPGVGSTAARRCSRQHDRLDYPNGKRAVAPLTGLVSTGVHDGDGFLTPVRARGAARRISGAVRDYGHPRRTDTLAWSKKMEHYMPVYGIGIVNSLKDEAAFGEYRKVAAEALGKHGGKIVVPPSPPTTLDGDDNPKAIVLLSFPSKAAAQAWRDDPDLQDIHAMRNAGVDMTIYAFGEE